MTDDPMMILFALWVVFWNLLAYLMFWLDKQYARKDMWRIPEKTLIISALLGGSVGALLGMKHFRHKTKHPKFTLGIPAILIVQAVCIAVYIIT
ncbi:MAG: DUF1294 domain-containing protein [Erysipelotrichaceae bacterium]|nr:DUF1294 domain-containing protein [Erysipelotrichaceae bacterium]